MFQIDRNVTAKFVRSNGTFTLSRGNDKQVGDEVLRVMSEKNHDIVRIEILKGIVGKITNDPYSTLVAEYRLNEDGEWVN